MTAWYGIVDHCVVCWAGMARHSPTDHYTGMFSGCPSGTWAFVRGIGEGVHFSVGVLWDSQTPFPELLPVGQGRVKHLHWSPSIFPVTLFPAVPDKLYVILLWALCTPTPQVNLVFQFPSGKEQNISKRVSQCASQVALGIWTRHPRGHGISMCWHGNNQAPQNKLDILKAFIVLCGGRRQNKLTSQAAWAFQP